MFGKSGHRKTWELPTNANTNSHRWSVNWKTPQPFCDKKEKTSCKHLHVRHQVGIAVDERVPHVHLGQRPGEARVEADVQQQLHEQHAEGPVQGLVGDGGEDEVLPLRAQDAVAPEQVLHHVVPLWWKQTAHLHGGGGVTNFPFLLFWTRPVVNMEVYQNWATMNFGKSKFGPKLLI